MHVIVLTNHNRSERFGAKFCLMEAKPMIAGVVDDDARGAIAIVVKSEIDLLFSASCSRLASSDTMISKTNKVVHLLFTQCVDSMQVFDPWVLMCECACIHISGAAISRCRPEVL